MMTAASVAERRVAPRFQPAFGTVCRLGPGWPRVGLVWNISQTGVSMLMGDPPPSGAELGAVLTADGRDVGLSVTLRVVHVREVATGDYLLGARFNRALEDDEMQPFLTPIPEGGNAVPPKG